MEAIKEYEKWILAEIDKSKAIFKDLNNTAVARLNAGERASNLMDAYIAWQNFEMKESVQQIESWSKPGTLCAEIKRQSENDMIQTTSDTPASYMHISSQEREELERVSKAKISNHINK